MAIQLKEIRVFAASMAAVFDAARDGTYNSLTCLLGLAAWCVGRLLHLGLLLGLPSSTAQLEEWPYWGGFIYLSCAIY